MWKEECRWFIVIEIGMTDLIDNNKNQTLDLKMKKGVPNSP